MDNTHSGQRPERFTFPPEIPEIGAKIQVHLGNRGIIETTVMGRRVVEGTYYVYFSHPAKGYVPSGDSIGTLSISPGTSERGMVDRANDFKPYWRLMSDEPGGSHTRVTIFI